MGGSAKIEKLAGCDGKFGFSYRKATEAKRRMKRSGKIVRRYHCQHCGFWHLGGVDLKVKRDTNDQD